MPVNLFDEFDDEPTQQFQPPARQTAPANLFAEYADPPDEPTRPVAKKKKSDPNNLFAEFADLPDEPQRSAIGEIATGLRTGVTEEIPLQAGQAMQWIGEADGGGLKQKIYETGKGIADSAKARQQRPENTLYPDQHNAVTNALAEGGKMIAPSVAAPAVIGGGLAALGAAAPSLAVGGTVGLGIASALGSLPAAMQQGQQTMESVQQAGGTDETALSAGRKNAVIEGLGEAVGTFAGGKFLGIAGKALGKTSPGISGAISGATDTSIWKPFAKGLVTTALVETGTEIGQSGGQALVERSAGVDIDPIEQMQGVVAPTLGMTALLAPFGLHANYRNSKNAAAVNTILSDPSSAEPEQRQAVVDELHRQAVAGNVPDADQWLVGASDDVANNRPIRRDATQTAPPQGPISKALGAAQPIQQPAPDDVSNEAILAREQQQVSSWHDSIKNPEFEQQMAAYDQQAQADQSQLSADDLMDDFADNYGDVQQQDDIRGRRQKFIQMSGNREELDRNTLGRPSSAAEAANLFAEYGPTEAERKLQREADTAEAFKNLPDSATQIDYISDKEAEDFNQKNLARMQRKQWQEGNRKYIAQQEQDEATITDANIPAEVKRQARIQASSIVSADPVYQHMEEAKKRGGLNLEAFKADYDKTSVDQIIRRYPGIFSRVGTIKPDEFAAEQGYESLDDMVQKFAHARTKRELQAKIVRDLHGQWQDAEAASKQDIDTEGRREWAGTKAAIKPPKTSYPASEEDITNTINVIQRYPESADEVMDHWSFSPAQKQRLVAARDEAIRRRQNDTVRQTGNQVDGEGTDFYRGAMAGAAQGREGGKSRFPEAEKNGQKGMAGKGEENPTGSSGRPAEMGGRASQNEESANPDVITTGQGQNASTRNTQTPTAENNERIKAEQGNNTGNTPAELGRNDRAQAAGVVAPWQMTREEYAKEQISTASKLWNKIDAVKGEIVSLMGVGAGEVKGSGFGGANFSSPRNDIDQTERIRKKYGTDKLQGEKEAELKNLMRLHDLAKKRLDSSLSEHREQVLSAVQRGRDIPDSVFDEYPDIFGGQQGDNDTDGERKNNKAAQPPASSTPPQGGDPISPAPTGKPAEQSAESAQSPVASRPQPTTPLTSQSEDASRKEPAKADVGEAGQGSGKYQGFSFSENDIPYQAAYDAHRGSSFTPDKRAEQERAGYVSHMQNTIDTLSKYAKTDEQKADLQSWFNTVYKPGYVSRYLAKLSADSRTMSSMITGPANFPTRSNQKKLDAAENRYKELAEWEQRVFNRMKRNLTGKEGISSTDPDALDKLKEKLAKLESSHELMKEANKIIKSKKLSDTEKIAALVEMKFTEKQAKEVLQPDYAGRIGFAAYVSQNSNANIKTVKDRIAALEQRAEKATETGGSETREFDGGSVELNHEDGYVRIFHDSKPSEAVRQQLKSNGFRWSPTDSAWRRKLNNSSQWKAEEITGVKFGKEASKPESNFSPKNAILLVADDIETLRPQDVYRVLDSVDGANREALKAYIVKNHSDNQRILDSVREAIDDLSAEESGTLKNSVATSPAYSKTPHSVFTLSRINPQVNASGITSWQDGFTRAGLKQDTTQQDIINELQKVIGAPVTAWSLPDNLVTKKASGRVAIQGTPKSDFEAAERLARIFGKKVVWSQITANYRVNGLMVQNNPKLDKHIFIDLRSPLPMHTVFGHELTHHIEKDMPRLFNDIYDAIQPFIKDVKKYQDLRKLEGMTERELRTEIVADFMGDNFASTEFWQAVQGKTGNRWQRIARHIMSWIDNLLGRVTWGTTYGSEQFVSDVKAARDILAKGVREYAGAQKEGGAQSGGVNQFAQSAGVSLGAAKRVIQNMPAFRKWFDGSKVVDEDGSPLVVYHGTTANFKEFKQTTETGKQSRSGFNAVGHWFTTDTEYADSFSRGATIHDQKPDSYKDGSKIIPAYLSFKNPMYVSAETFSGGLTPGDETYIRNNAEVDGFDSIILINNIGAFRVGDNKALRDILEREELSSDEDPADLYDPQLFEAILPAIDVHEAITAGAIVVDLSAGGVDFVAFNPTQIKSIFNQGKWDVTNPDILRSAAGPSENLVNWLGKSKVKATVYHGSPTFGQGSNFTFDPNRATGKTSSPGRGLGTFFTEDPLEARAYAGASGAVESLRLRIENPLEINSYDLPRFQNVEEARAFRKRKELQGYDGIHIVDEGHWVIFEPGQAKSADKNNGEYSSENQDIRYSAGFTFPSLPFTGSMPRSFGLVREYLNRPETKAKWENIASYAWDKDAAIARVQKEIGPQPETRDYNLLRRLTGKSVSDEIALFDREKLNPLLKEMAEAKVNFDEVGELAWAEHAPERNLQMRRVNARRYIDNLLQQFTDKEKEQYQERLGFIQDEFVMNDQTRNQRRDNFVALLNEMTAEIISTENQVRQGISQLRPDWQQNAEERLNKRLETARKWEDVKDHLSGMTDKEAGEIVRKWENDSRYAGIRSVVDKMRAINEAALEMNYAAGELTKEEYEAIKNTYKYHVPLYREDMDEGKAPTGKVGVGPLASPIKIAAGSTRAVVDILPHIVDRYQSAIQRKHKLEAGRALYEMVKNNPDESRWMLAEQEKKPYADSEGNIRFYADQVLNPLYETKVKVDGKQYIIAVPKDNKAMLRWMQALNREPVQLGPIIKASQKITRLLAALNTTASPEFLLTNFARDIQTAGIHLEDTAAKGMQKTVLKGIKGAIKGIFLEERQKQSGEWGKVYRDFSKHGGKISWMQGYEDVAELAKNLESELAYAEGKKPKRAKFREFTRFVGAMNTAVENGVRLSTYKALVDSGVSPRKAAHTASNLTVDFTRHGTAGPTMNALFMFANAGLQGSVRMFKALRNPKVQKIAGGIMAFGFAANIIGAFAGGDDDDGEAYYDKLKRTNPSLFERNMVFMIPGTEGKHIKIPMPYGYNTLFVAGNELAGALRGGSPVDGMARTATAFMDSFNPLGSATILQTIMPTVLDPVAQVMENKSWNGQALMPESNPFGIEKPDSERYFKSVNPIARFATRMINDLTGGSEVKAGLIDVSPETVEMLVETFTGSLGKLAKDTLSLPISAATGDLEMHKVPFARKFVGGKSDYIDASLYRENRDTIEQFEKEYEAADGAEKIAMRRDEKFRLIAATKDAESRLRRTRKRLENAKSRGNSQLADKLEEQMKTIYSGYNLRYNRTFS